MRDSYNLIVSTQSNGSEFIPYLGQKIAGLDLSTKLSLTSGLSPFPSGRYLVAVNDEATEVTALLKSFEPLEWLLPFIDEVNKHNKNMQSTSNNRFKVAKPDYVFVDDTLWEFLISTVQLGLYPLVTGPTGSGKTVVSKAVADALGYDFYPINCGSMFKPKSSLVGTVSADNGSTQFNEAEFLKYFKSDRPTVIYLDEVSRIPSGAANMLFPVLDREQNYLYIEERAERVFRGENVTFIGSANFGAQYVDARSLDNAFANRWVPYHLSYLPPHLEEQLIIMKVPGVKPRDVSKLITVANKLRSNYETLGQEVSHRHTIDMSRYLKKGFTLLEIVDNVLIGLFLNGNDDRRSLADKIIKSVM